MKDQEQVLLNVRQSAKDMEEELNEKLRELESQLEGKEIKLRDVKWEREDRERELGSTILRCLAYRLLNDCI
jgi:hypothetical protein